MNAYRERRCKVAYIEPEVIMTLLGRWKEGDCVTLPVIEGIPDDYTVNGVQYIFERNAFAVLISHPSFDIVPVAENVPPLNQPGSTRVETVCFENRRQPWGGCVWHETPTGVVGLPKK